MFLPELRRSSCVHGRGIDQLSEPGYGNIPGDRMPETHHVQERTQISRQNEIGAFLATSLPRNEDTETPTFGAHTDLLGELRTDECVVLMAIELGCWMPACSRQLPSDGNTFNLDRCSELLLCQFGVIVHTVSVEKNLSTMDSIIGEFTLEPWTRDCHKISF